MRNKIKAFLETRRNLKTGKPGTSAYRFWKDTNLSRPTAYRLVADPTYIPTGDVLDKICSAYRIQPGELLVWLPDSED
jgi:Cro/C1-type HTH DNA-binding domain